MTPKLVRDRIPDLIRARGDDPVVRRCADDGEYRRLLARKLLEEAEEAYELADSAWLRDDPASSSAELAEELADVLEVAHALADAFGVTRDELHRAAQLKRHDRGGFGGRIVWEGNR